MSLNGFPTSQLFVANIRSFDNEADIALRLD